MILHLTLLFLPAVISQFLPMNVEPDVAFGDQNDRFDLSAVYKPLKHKFRSNGDRRRQFLPMALAPDVAFGDHNDRFDLTGIDQHKKHKFRSDDDLRRTFRRYISPELSEGLNYRRSAYQPNLRRVPLDEDWLEDMTNVAEDRRADGEVFINRAQDYRRHHPLRTEENTEGVATDKPETETRLKYAPPLKIKLQDRAIGNFTFNFNL